MKTITYISLILVLLSCESPMNELKKENSDLKNQNKELKILSSQLDSTLNQLTEKQKELDRTYKEKLSKLESLNKQLNKSSSSTSNTSQESIKVTEIGLEVMKRDIGFMKSIHTKEFFVDLGDGWRLPTIDELNKLYKYRGRIGRFKDDYYLSSTENQRFWMWTLSFEDGSSDNLRNSGYVRAVRDLK